MKTIHDAKCSCEIALTCACSAKNSLNNNGGYSSNQLVFGHNVNLPSVLTDELPAMEKTSSSELIRQHLKAIHSARKSFIEAKNSDKIRRAVRHKTRLYIEENYQNGKSLF